MEQLKKNNNDNQNTKIQYKAKKSLNLHTKSNIQEMINQLDNKLYEFSVIPNDRLPSPKDFLATMNRQINLFKTNTALPQICDYKKETDETLYENVLSKYRKKALLARRNKKIFTIYGQQSTIQKSLLERGWIEKSINSSIQHLNKLPKITLIRLAAPGNNYEKILLSKLIYNYPTNFLWNPKNYECHAYGKVHPYRNRIKLFGNLQFSNKYGLINCIENSHWNSIDNVSDIHVPRFHRLTSKEEHKEFLRDYRTTYCLSLLNYISEQKKTNHKLYDDNGVVPLNIIDFAIDRIMLEIGLHENDQIQSNFKDNEEPDKDKEWKTFYKLVDGIVNNKMKFRFTNKIQINDYHINCAKVLRGANKYWPNLSADGYRNLWILKPGFACRGRGIFIKQSYDDIFNIVLNRHDVKYIVQKYIERPLLIYKTKFDIRQYMLLTMTEDKKFNIWMYKNCYLRFSSQEYKLSNLNESVHITNNSVQKKYENGIRSYKLPDHNMWSLNEFKSYLSTIGKGDLWQSRIYPGMKKNCTGIVLASVEDIDFITKSFELYGCDFMLDENYEPILIEINSIPDMSPSTVITATICPATLEDLIKVVVDLPKNSNSETGNFELIYSINYDLPKSTNNFKDEIIGQKMSIMQLSDIELSEKELTLSEKQLTQEAEESFQSFEDFLNSNKSYTSFQYETNLYYDCKDNENENENDIDIENQNHNFSENRKIE